MPVLLWMGVAALGIAFARETRRTLFARSITKSGLRVIAVAPVGGLELIAIEPRSGVSIVPRLWHLADLKGARLLRITPKSRSVIAPAEVWELVSQLRFMWYPPLRYGNSPGYGWFVSFLQANRWDFGPELKSVQQAQSRQAGLIAVALVSAAAIIFALWATGLIGQPTDFP